MYIGQVVDIYEVSEGLTITLWSGVEQKKRTISIIGLHGIVMGDVVQIHGGVGSDATVLPERMFPVGFKTIIDHPNRIQPLEIALPAVAYGATDHI